MSASGSRPPDRAGSESRIRQALEAAPVPATSAAHDETVLAAARTFAEERSASARGDFAPARRPRRWLVPASLAASLLVGILVGRTLLPVADAPMAGAPGAQLYLPAEVVRGESAGRATPVEQADPERWYRYIQELVAAGERAEAEAHLRRFNELHPGYVHRP